jgi:hypothetical protein
VAIKGKSKSRGAKAVTRGPKPAYVPVKTPLLRRRGLWMGVGLVLGVAAIAGIAYGVIQERNRDREAAQQLRMATAMDEYAAAVEPVLTTVGQSLPPTSFDAFPALSTVFEDLAAEDVSEESLQSSSATAESVTQAALDASSRLEEVSPTDLVAGRDLTREFVSAVIISHHDFLLSMDLYREVGLLLSMAVEGASARDDLVARAQGVHDAAERAFAQAYNGYVEAQVAAGTFAPSPLGPTGGTG